jgi:hypothetical protein
LKNLLHICFIIEYFLQIQSSKMNPNESFAYCFSGCFEGYFFAWACQLKREDSCWKDQVFARTWLGGCEHSYREAKQCPNSLANYGCSLVSRSIIFYAYSSSISNLLLADLFRVNYYPHVISSFWEISPLFL